MTAKQWQRVRDLFEHAIEQQPADIGAWLRAEEADDAEVRAEVSSLLQHHTNAGAFLAESVATAMPDLLSEDRALVEGQAVGPYTIVREIGRGGMGRVYLARDERLGRTLALKALPPELTGNLSQRERLRREARAAAALTHPGICTVYALEELDGELYIATEFVDGRTLREEIASGVRPTPDTLLATARDLAEALASAHTSGVTHRDLKPENIIRATNGRVKILDFGLARIASPSGDAPAAPITLEGTLVGTPAYMAPEQLNGRAVDARADVFAFGVVMYEFATGTHPFEAATPLAVVGRVLEGGHQSVGNLRQDLPRTVVAVIERCLKKAPGDRFASAGEIVQALAANDTAAALTPVASSADGWWRTHQIAVLGLYFVASVLAWQVKEWERGAIATALFFAICIGATIAGVFRGHLLFTARQIRGRLDTELDRAGRVTIVMDVVIALALAAAGLLAARHREVAGVLTVALAVGIALTRMVLEPSTTAAAFGRADGVD